MLSKFSIAATIFNTYVIASQTLSLRHHAVDCRIVHYSNAVEPHDFGSFARFRIDLFASFNQTIHPTMIGLFDYGKTTALSECLSRPELDDNKVYDEQWPHMLFQLIHEHPSVVTVQKVIW